MNQTIEDNQTKPKNRRSNLAVLIILVMTFGCGVAWAITMASDGITTTTEAFQAGAVIGVAVTGCLALATMSVLAIMKARKTAGVTP